MSLFNPLFDEAHTAMSSAVQLLNQNLSGTKTQQNQENAKNIISDLINLLIEGQANGNTNESEKDFSMLDFLLMEQAEGSPKRGESKSPTPGKRRRIKSKWQKRKNLLLGWRGPRMS